MYSRIESLLPDLWIDQRCAVCGAQLSLSREDEARGRQPICLNACHLGEAGQKRFAAMMANFGLPLAAVSAMGVLGQGANTTDSLPNNN